ncbi:hypothetical protein Clacol_005306 [Clathrus columnatus]|uniref:Protein kinase domain-containing protein n=1 Tax=Clathrus columnatus TaxID=1419009 RepID=A0AAV5ADT1_9AGAM|nr:hypothetical protein Clacol_005306 [Clathrus columnatus]
MVNGSLGKKEKVNSSSSSSSTNSSTSTSSSDQASPRSSGSRRGRKMTRDSVNPLSAENLRKRGYHTLYSSFKPFHVENRWRLVQELGQGAYGMVISAEDKISGETIAIKMVTRVFDKIQLAKRALREIVLLRHFSTRGHENVTGLIDLDAIHPDFNEIYIFMEPMEADLHQIIRSGQQLTSEHVQYFLYQILRGMKYIHTASVIHRDLKPGMLKLGNLLINSDCELKICDFGLANTFEARLDGTVPRKLCLHLRPMERQLRYVVTNSNYRIFHRYEVTVDQLNRILDVLGTPKEDVFAKISSDRAKAYMRSLPIRKPQAFAEIQLAIDLLSKMITWDPDKRLTVTEALSHPWLANYHDPADEPACPAKFDRYKEYEHLTTLEEFRAAIWKEIQDFRKEVRSLHPPIASALPSEPETEKQEEVPELSNSTPTTPTESPVASTVADAISSRVLTQTITEEPATEVERDEPIDGLPLPRLRDQSTLVGSGDPIATYRRRSSILQSTGSPSMQARSSLYSHSQHPSFPSSGQEGEVSYVIPARSRAASMLSGQSQLLRTLSTFSIHEKMDETGKLLPPEPTGADAPPSSIPREFVSIEGENNIQE